jgi:hypothetical protein
LEAIVDLNLGQPKIGRKREVTNNSLTHTSSAHILKEVAVTKRRREVHAQSYFILGGLVLVLALYWKSIIEEVLLGFLSHVGFLG